jgi:hypothetical protein
MPWKEHCVSSVTLPAVLQQDCSHHCPVFRAPPLHIFLGNLPVALLRFGRLPLHLCGSVALACSGMPYAEGHVRRP